MKNVTKMKISKPARNIFKAFVDPEKIGSFWFSSSSVRWEEGRNVTLRYDEYNAQVDILIKEIEANKKIVFEWGIDHIVTISFVDSEHNSTIVEVIEEGFENDHDDYINELIDNKEGWVYMLTCLKGYMEHGVDLRASIIK